LILHWNGRVWQEVASPRVDGGLDGVAARSRSDVWAIGNRLDFAYGAAYTLVEHWNGREWKIVPSANRVLYDKADNGLSSVAPISGHDVWVVGSFWDGINDTGGSLIEQWNGHRWHIVPSPAGLDRLHAIGVASARDIWAAGDHSDGNTFRPLVERWDGQRWRILYRPPLSGSFWAMLVRSPNDVWFLGESRSRPLVRRWNGTGFRDAAAPSIPGGVIEAAAQTGNVVWAGGGTRALKTSRPFIARYLCRP
jgi:hypothetical protein